MEGVFHFEGSLEGFERPPKPPGKQKDGSGMRLGNKEDRGKKRWNDKQHNRKR